MGRGPSRGAAPGNRLDTHARLRLMAARLPRPVVWGIIAFAFVLAITISTGSSAEFIYFEF